MGHYVQGNSKGSSEVRHKSKDFLFEKCNN